MAATTISPVKARVGKRKPRNVVIAAGASITGAEGNCGTDGRGIFMFADGTCGKLTFGMFGTFGRFGMFGCAGSPGIRRSGILKSGMFGESSPSEDPRFADGSPSRNSIDPDPTLR